MFTAPLILLLIRREKYQPGPVLALRRQFEACIGRNIQKKRMRHLDQDTGAIACRLPLPPGTLPGFWQADERYRQNYLERFPDFYETGDAGFIDEDGYVFVMSRTDDIINVAGHRLSTGAIEEVLAAHPDVAECAVFGVTDELKGQLPLGLLVLKAGADRNFDDVAAESIRMVRDSIGPVAAFKKAAVVARLPKTRSGKILRGTMRRIADSEGFRMPATIEDPDVLEEIREILMGLGYARDSQEG